MSFDYEYIGSKYIKYQIYTNFTKFLQLLGIYSRLLNTRSVSNFLSLSKKIGLTHLSNHSAFPFSLNWGNHSLSRAFVKETFTFYLAPPWPTLGHYWVDSRPEGNRESRNEDGSISPAEHLVEVEPATFKF